MGNRFGATTGRPVGEPETCTRQAIPRLGGNGDRTTTRLPRPPNRRNAVAWLARGRASRRRRLAWKRPHRPRRCAAPHAPRSVPSRAGVARRDHLLDTGTRRGLSRSCDRVGDLLAGCCTQGRVLPEEPVIPRSGQRRDVGLRDQRGTRRRSRLALFVRLATYAGAGAGAGTVDPWRKDEEGGEDQDRDGDGRLHRTEAICLRARARRGTNGSPAWVRWPSALSSGSAAVLWNAGRWSRRNSPSRSASISASSPADAE